MATGIKVNESVMPRAREMMYVNKNRAGELMRHCSTIADPFEPMGGALRPLLIAHFYRAFVATVFRQGKLLRLRFSQPNRCLAKSAAAFALPYV